MPIKPNSLKVLRAERMLSQFKASQAVRISMNRWCRIENGQAEPLQIEVAAIAAFFNVKPSRFYTKAEAA